MTQLLGGDFSLYQGNINWPALAKSGCSFAIVKATEGTSYVDKNFQENWKGAKAAGLLRGAYCFVHPDLGNNPTYEAQFFLNTVGKLENYDVLALDIEVGGGDLSAYALEWLRYVAKEVGFNPFVYSYTSFFEEHFSDPALAEFPLWIAQYSSQIPSIPKPFSQISMWQNSEQHSFPGLGACDSDIFFGTADQWGKLGYGKQSIPVKSTILPMSTQYKVIAQGGMYLRATARLSSAHGSFVKEGTILKESSTGKSNDQWRAVLDPGTNKTVFAYAPNLSVS